MKKFNLIGTMTLGALLVSSCMSSTVLKVVKPADVDVPSEIATFAVVQRNEAPKGKKLAKRWEGFVSGEAIGMDKRSAGYASTGLILELSKSPRFTIKQAHVNNQLYGTGTSKMAEPLNWEEVEEICTMNNSEALIVVEAFDSDVRRNSTSRDVTRKVTGGEVTETIFDTKLNVRVEIGWRIYYPKNKEIIDVFNDQTNASRNASGATEEVSRGNLPRVENVVQRSAQELGVAYARRISPTHVTLTRLFYGKGSVGLKLAKTKMMAKDYEAAIDMWNNEFNNTLEQKIKGKTAYNLAVGYEAMGDYEKAIEWAIESVANGNRKAKGYLTLLEQRKVDNERLQKQMEVKK